MEQQLNIEYFATNLAALARNVVTPMSDKAPLFIVNGHQKSICRQISDAAEKFPDFLAGADDATKEAASQNLLTISMNHEDGRKKFLPHLINLADMGLVDVKAVEQLQAAANKQSVPTETAKP